MSLPPSDYETELLRLLSNVFGLPEELWVNRDQLNVPLLVGDRVFMDTDLGSYRGTVERDWHPPASAPLDSEMVRVRLDATGSVVTYHRCFFRTFSALDHISEA